MLEGDDVSGASSSSAPFLLRSLYDFNLYFPLAGNENEKCSLLDANLSGRVCPVDGGQRSGGSSTALLEPGGFF